MGPLTNIDINKKKIGILGLSAIKLKPKIERLYKLKSKNDDELKSINFHLRNAGYVADNYREWLEEADVQVIPILFYQSFEELKNIIKSLDGFVLTGGSEQFLQNEGVPSLYLKTVEFVLKVVKEINDEGRQYPLWGTCLGFEALLVAESENVLKRERVFNHVKLREKIEITDSTLRSMQIFTQEELDRMESVPLLYFNHMWGVSRKGVNDLEELSGRVKIGAKINTDYRRNVAAWMEFINYPIFGTQFHPEKEALSGANPFNQKRDQDLTKMMEKNFVELNISSLGDFHFGFDAFFAHNIFETKKKEEVLDNIDKDVEYVEKTENEKLLDENEDENDEGVDEEWGPIVDDPSKIDQEYLNNVKMINHKFAEFFASMVTAAKKKLPEYVLDKSIFSLNNIGTYYQINLIKNN